jgi:D-alanyl-D-alanine carboxypeptidase
MLPRIGRRHFLIGGLGMLSAACAVRNHAPPQAVKATLEDGLTMNLLKILPSVPGISAAWRSRNGESGQLSLGFADKKTKLPVTADTKFLGASVGKMFCGALALSARDDGLVKLDEPLSAYLGDVDWFDQLPNASALSLRTLLRHTSGIPDHVDMAEYEQAITEKFATEGPDAILSPAELVSFVLDKPAISAAGEAFLYSDTNYVIAAMALEKVLKGAYYDLVATHLLKPLDLSATVPSNTRTIANLATGYVAPGNAFGLPPTLLDDQGNLVVNPGDEWAGGGYAMTATDLMRWTYAFANGTALQGSYLEDLLDIFPTKTLSHASGYGIGIMAFETSLGIAYGHSGYIPGYMAHAAYCPNADVAAAVLVNTTGASTYADRSEAPDTFEAMNMILSTVALS